MRRSRLTTLYKCATVTYMAIGKYISSLAYNERRTRGSLDFKFRIRRANSYIYIFFFPRTISEWNNLSVSFWRLLQQLNLSYFIIIINFQVNLFCMEVTFYLIVGLISLKNKLQRTANENAASIRRICKRSNI